MAAPRKQQARYAITAVGRAIDVLEAFSSRQPELLLTEIAEYVGLPTTTVFRMLSSLAQRGLVSRDAGSGKYRLGYKMIEFADLAKAPNDLLTKARPVMRQIRDATNETTYISVRSGEHRIDLEQVEGTLDVRRVVAVGRSQPLFVGAPGKVFLSAEDGAWVRDYLERARAVEAPHGAIHGAQLQRELKQIRANGYAETRRKTGAGAISAPVRGAAGEVIAALTVSAPFVRYTTELRSKILSSVLEGAASVSNKMGWRGSTGAGRR